MKKNIITFYGLLSIILFSMILALTVHIFPIKFPFIFGIYEEESTAENFNPDNVEDFLRNNSKNLDDKLLLRFLASKLIKIEEEMKTNSNQFNTQIETVSHELKNIKDEYQSGKESEMDILTQNNGLIKQYDSSLKEMTARKSDNGPQTGKSKRFRKELLLADDPETWRQRTFTHHGTFGFVKFSAYRMSPNKFASIGLGALSMRESRYLNLCTWHGKGGKTINGKLHIMFMEEHHSNRYEVVVIQCHLSKDTEGSGGYLTGVIDDEEILFFREEKGKPIEAKAPFENNLTFCSPPMHGSLHSKNLFEWFEYNRVILGADKFILYDIDALDSGFMKWIAPYVDAGMIEITDFRQATAYHVWYYSQGLAINDCIYRTRFSSKWIFMADFDEYIEVLPPHTLGGILSKYEDKPWLTHGVLWWTSEKCKEETDDKMFAAERTVFHWPHTYCQSKLYDPAYCQSAYGHRKYFINPRLTELAQIHQINVPIDGGVDLNVLTEMRHNHFRGLAEAKAKCKELVPRDKNIEWWVRDEHLEDLFDRVRQCPIGDRTCVAQHDENAIW